MGALAAITTDDTDRALEGVSRLLSTVNLPGQVTEVVRHKQEVLRSEVQAKHETLWASVAAIESKLLEGLRSGWPLYGTRSTLWVIWLARRSPPIRGERRPASSCTNAPASAFGYYIGRGARATHGTRYNRTVRCLEIAGVLIR